jgi:hypothetical protein
LPTLVQQSVFYLMPWVKTDFSGIDLLPESGIHSGEERAIGHDANTLSHLGRLPCSDHCAEVWM